MTILKRMVPAGLAFGLALAVAGLSASGFDRSSAASAAAQGSPVPTVSVTTLPAMPGPAAPSATLMPSAEQTASPARPGASWTMPIAPPLGVSYIQVVGDVDRPLTITLKDLERMKPASLTLHFHVYTGVPLVDVLNRAGLRFSSDPQTLMRKYVYVQGIDGRAAMVGFPEFTKEFGDQLVLLAYREDFRNIPGPGFAMLVVQGDKTTTRYINVARIIVGEPLQQM